MGPEALAVLRVRYDKVARGLRAHEDPGVGVKLFANDAGQLLGLSKLKDATVVHTFLPFFSSPDELSLGVGQLLGELLRDHDDERGVFIVPDHRQPAAKSYARYVEDAEHDGLWVPLASPERVVESIEKRTEQVVEFMAQMTALNQATAAGDARSVAKAKRALKKAFDDAHSSTVRTVHPLARKVRSGGKKAIKKLKSAFEGVKLDDVQLPDQWQKAADEARAIIQKEVAASKKKVKTLRSRKKR